MSAVVSIGSGNHSNHYKTHGNSRTKLYKVWSQMKQRCYNENDSSYKNYGAKDISICEEWKDGFESFLDWSIQNGYKEGHDIDRINSKGNYSPKNCQWIERSAHRAKDSSFFKQSDFDKINGMYQNGMSLRSIGVVFGTTHNAVSNLLRSNNIDIKNRVSIDDVDEAIECYFRSKISLRELSRQSNICRRKLSKHIKEAS